MPEPDKALTPSLRSLPLAKQPGELEPARTRDPGLGDTLPMIIPALADNPIAPEMPVEAMAFAFNLALERDVDETPGSRIGPYKLLEVIGRGGFGVVWMAEQMEPIRRRVALKIIKSGMDTKEVIARFEAERQALALMDHPHIARVFDAGATEIGRPYFAMELVRGETITRYCDNNHLPAIERLRLFMAVCHAVQHAHQKGVIHRDLKPSNILVTLHDGVPVPKVIDFGIAKATSGRLTEKTLFTHFHAFIGTPAYTSPEQMEMSGLDVDTRSDIYSLGVLLYELLTGCPPFDPDTLARSGLEAMRRTIREVDPPLPSQCLARLSDNNRTSVALRQGTNAARLLLQLRGDLDWIVMRCLEKDRRRRYETASELARDVQRHLDSEPVTAGQPSAAYVLRKMLRRNRLAFTAAGAVVVALVAGLVVAVWSLRREHLALNQAHLEAIRSAQVAQFMKDMLKGIRPQVARGRDATVLREIADQTALRVRRELADEPAVRAELLETLGMVYHDIGEDIRAEALLRDALNAQRTMHGPENENIARLLHELGGVAVQRDQFFSAEELLQEALAMRRHLLGPSHPDVAETLSLLGFVRAFYSGNSADGTKQLTEALEIQRRVLGNEQTAVAETLVRLGDVLSLSEKPAAGEALIREALALYGHKFGDDAPETIAVRIELANCLAAEDRPTEAEAIARNALAATRKVLGNTHPLVAQALLALAGSGLKDQGAEAEATLREAFVIARKSENSLAVPALNELCFMLMGQGRAADAEEVAREAVTFGREHYRQDDPLMLGDHLATLGAILIQQKKYAEAEPVARECLAIREAHDPKGWRIVSSRTMVGNALLGLHRFGEAEPILLSSYQLFLRRAVDVPNMNRDYLRETLEALVELYAQWDRPESVAQWKRKLTEFLASSPDADWPGLEADEDSRGHPRWTYECCVQLWSERQRPDKVALWKAKLAALDNRPAR